MKWIVMLMLGMGLTNAYAGEAVPKETAQSHPAVAADKKNDAQLATESASKHEVLKTQFLGKRPYMATSEKK